MKCKGAKHYESKVISKLANGGKVEKPKVLKTTRTPDGGQQYVRNDDYKVAGKVAERVGRMGRNDPVGTISPKAARIATEAEYYALSPKDKDLAKDMGKITEKFSNKRNQNLRNYGDRTRR